MHVIRCFEDPDVTHVMGAVDPVRDREVIDLELALSDLATVDKRLDRVRRTAKTNDKDALAELPALEAAHAALSAGHAVRSASFDARFRAMLAPLSLLTAKPVLYAANVTDAELAGAEGPHCRRCARRSPSRASTRRSCPSPPRSKPSSRSCRRRIARIFSRRSGSDQRTRPPDPRGIPPPRAPDVLHRGRAGSAGVDHPPRRYGAGRGGVIHTDFERGFIRAETVSLPDFVANAGWKGARERGVVRSEGKEYVVQDGDVLLFRFNV